MRTLIEGGTELISSHPRYRAAGLHERDGDFAFEDQVLAKIGA